MLTWQIAKAIASAVLHSASQSLNTLHMNFLTMSSYEQYFAFGLHYLCRSLSAELVYHKTQSLSCC